MKKVMAVGTALILAVLFAWDCFAGNASTYKVTIQSVQLKKSDGSWITIASPNQEIDIAAVSANAVAGSLFSDAYVPDGTYVNFKVVLSETMKFSGTDGGFNTRGGGSITISGNDATDASTATWASDPPNATLTETVESATTGTAGEVAASLDLDASDSDSYIEIYAAADQSPITISMYSAVSMYFTFDTQNTVHYVNNGGNDIMYFTPPQSGTSFSITVDGTSWTITAANMRIDF